MEVVARREQIPGEALNSTQRELLDRLVDLLDGDQMIWVQGYLAGVAQARTGAVGGAAAAVAMPPVQPVRSASRTVISPTPMMIPLTSTAHLPVWSSASTTIR